MAHVLQAAFDHPLETWIKKQYADSPYDADAASAPPAPGIVSDDATGTESVHYEPLDIPPVAMQKVLGHRIFSLDVTVFYQFFAF